MATAKGGGPTDSPAGTVTSGPRRAPAASSTRGSTYRYHLGRTPSRAELAEWLDVAQADQTAANVVAFIAESDEAKARTKE